MKRSTLLVLTGFLFLAPRSSAESHGDAVPAAEALKRLEAGNARFAAGHPKAKVTSEDRRRLAAGQHPHTIILSCADSRVPPELVFDQGAGDVFVVRAAGEALDSAVIASLEYAVDHLGPRSLVVMGHTSCGAVSAALKTPEGKSAGSPSLDRLVADIKPRLGKDSGAPSPDLEKESFSNARGVAADLPARSEIIREAVKAGRLAITPALYHLDSGTVEFAPTPAAAVSK
jgi:carbonic anhydrase